MIFFKEKPVLIILGANQFQRWSINKQMQFEGGFQGRTNKLVDGCYSFWCGAIMPIVQALISKNGRNGASKFEIDSFSTLSCFDFIRRNVSKQYFEETAIQCDGVAGIRSNLLSTSTGRSHRQTRQVRDCNSNSI